MANPEWTDPSDWTDPADILYSALFRIVRENSHLPAKDGIEMGPLATIADAALREYQHLIATRAAAESGPLAPIWRPIAKAPMHELVWCWEPSDLGGFMFAGFSDEYGNWSNNLDGKTQHPTYWMKLPPVPEQGL